MIASAALEEDMDHDEEELINDDGDDSDETEGDFNLTIVDGLNASDVVRVVGVGGVATGIALYVLSFLTFVGNAMVLHAIRTEKRLQTVSRSVRKRRGFLHATGWSSTGYFYRREKKKVGKFC